MSRALLKRVSNRVALDPSFPISIVLSGRYPNTPLDPGHQYINAPPMTHGLAVFTTWLRAELRFCLVLT